MVRTPDIPLVIVRDTFLIDHTFGKFSLGGEYLCESLEPGRDHNRPSTPERRGACAPAGEYLMRWTLSPSHGWVWELQDVPNRSFMQIHAANWSRQLNGCIAPGLTRAVIDDHNPDTLDDRGVTSSRAALAIIHRRLEGLTTCRLVIIDATPEPD